MSILLTESAILDKKTDFPITSISHEERVQASLEKKLCEYFSVKFSNRKNTELPKIGHKPFKKLDYFIFDSVRQRLDVFLGFYETLSNEEKYKFCLWLVSQNTSLNILDDILKFEQEKSLTTLKDQLERKPKLSSKLLDYQKLTPAIKNILDVFSGPVATVVPDPNPGRAVCAEIASRKSYALNTVVINKFAEVSDFFSTMVECKTRPIKATYVFSGTHWNAGVIEIDKNNQAKFLLMDPLGVKFTSETKNIPLQLQLFLDAFPHGKPYCNATALQLSSTGCGIFSLDFARHIPKTEEYLKENLFDYFERHKVVDNPFAEKLTLSDLPLVLTRPMQKGLEEYIKNRPDEKEHAINKRSQKAEDCYVNDFVLYEEKKTQRSERIWRVREKFYNNLLTHFAQITEKQAYQEMEAYGMAGFMERMNRITTLKVKSDDKVIPEDHKTQDHSLGFPPSVVSKKSEIRDNPFKRAEDGREKKITETVQQYSGASQLLRWLVNRSPSQNNQKALKISTSATILKEKQQTPPSNAPR